MYPRAGDGRPPIDLELILRVYFLQHWFNLSDPGVAAIANKSARTIWAVLATGKRYQAAVFGAAV